MRIVGPATEMFGKVNVGIRPWATTLMFVALLPWLELTPAKS